MKNFVKNNKLIYIAVLLVIALVIGGYALSQAGLLSYNIIDDSKKSDAIFVEAPTFSAESGFYDDPFYLELSVPKGTKVYYTLDSSDPDENSIEYTGPIYLDDASKKENVYSMRTDVSAGFRTDLIDKYIDMERDWDHDEYSGYCAPDYKVDKCNVVKAIAVDLEGNRSSILSKSFFVGNFDSVFANGCKVASITTDPDNLFDYEKGILVTGKTFDTYIRKGKVNKAFWRWWDANYRQSGKEWHREAQIEFFDSFGEFISAETTKIATQGNASKGAIPRSLKVESIDSDGKTSSLDCELFKTDFNASRVIFSAGSSASITQFNDYMMGQRTENLNFATMDYEPYIMFLDGEYWGFYWLTERYDGEYLEYHYNVDKDNVIIIKEGKVSVGKENDDVLYNRMKNDIISADMSKTENYQMACDLIDMSSYIDYYATQIYIARSIDFPTTNFALWRTKEIRDDKYSDGKWRWMMFDSNSRSMRSDLINDDTLGYMLKNDEMFASLWENATFREEFKDRILEIADTCFEAKEMKDFISVYSTTMYPVMKKTWDRYYGKNNNKAQDYYNNINGFLDFFTGRKKTVELWFE